MSYEDAQQALERVPPNLIEWLKNEIRGYATAPERNGQVKSTHAARTMLETVDGVLFGAYSGTLAPQAMGILIREVLEFESGWSSERINEDNDLGHRIYTNPNS
jgi:hypothetical protein